MSGVKEYIATWMNLQQASRVLDAVLERSISEAADLSLAEYEALFRLHITGSHPLQMSEMAAQLINSPSGMTRIADRLEKTGLIARETPADNRRVVLVRLTDRGRKVLEQADAAFRKQLTKSFAAPLDPRDLADLRRLMRKLLESNGAWQDARCAPPI
jgi:DNA-binding MarR family transcriptional regulator